jgi:hypothetical protein
LNATATYGAIAIDSKSQNPLFGGGLALHWGDQTAANQGIRWSYAVSNVPSAGAGVIGIFQLVDGYRSGTFQNGTTGSTTTNGQYYLDTNLPYGNVSQNVSASHAPAITTLNDHPGLGLRNLVGATVTDSFNDYFMYRPNGGIWVPLGILSWGWNVNAAHAAAQQNWLVGQDGWSYQIVN